MATVYRWCGSVEDKKDSTLPLIPMVVRRMWDRRELFHPGTAVPFPEPLFGSHRGSARDFSGAVEIPQSAHHPAWNDDQGRWPLRNSFNGHVIADIEVLGQPSKWVTLRALRTLKWAHERALCGRNSSLVCPHTQWAAPGAAPNPHRKALAFGQFLPKRRS